MPRGGSHSRRCSRTCPYHERRLDSHRLRRQFSFCRSNPLSSRSGDSSAAMIPTSFYQGFLLSTSLSINLRCTRRTATSMGGSRSSSVSRKRCPAVVALDRFIDGEDSLYYIEELKANGYTGPIVVISVVDDEQAAISAG